jgi:hypothetical protein
VNTADDDDALLAIRPGAAADYSGGSSSTPNADYVTENSGQLEIVLDGTNTSGTGVNKDAVTDIDDLLHVVNQGTQTVAAWVTEGMSNDAVTFYDGTQGGPDDASIEGEGNAVELDVGDALDVSLEVDTTDNASDDPTTLNTVTFHADTEIDAGDVGGGQPTDGPTGGAVSVDGPFDDFASQGPTELTSVAFDARGKIGDAAGGSGSNEVEIRQDGDPITATKVNFQGWSNGTTVPFTLNYDANLGEAELQINGVSTQRAAVDAPTSDGRIAIEAKVSDDGYGTTTVENVAVGGQSIGSTDSVSKSYGSNVDGTSNSPSYAPDRVAHLVLNDDGAVDFSQSFTLTGDVTLSWPSGETPNNEDLAFDVQVE